jgi:hypothetical protein
VDPAIGLAALEPHGPGRIFLDAHHSYPLGPPQWTEARPEVNEPRRSRVARAGVSPLDGKDDPEPSRVFVQADQLGVGPDGRAWEGGAGSQIHGAKFGRAPRR